MAAQCYSSLVRGTARARSLPVAVHVPPAPASCICTPTNQQLVWRYLTPPLRFRSVPGRPVHPLSPSRFFQVRQLSPFRATHARSRGSGPWVGVGAVSAAWHRLRRRPVGYGRAAAAVAAAAVNPPLGFVLYTVKAWLGRPRPQTTMMMTSDVLMIIRTQPSRSLTSF